MRPLDEVDERAAFLAAEARAATSRRRTAAEILASNGRRRSGDVRSSLGEPIPSARRTRQPELYQDPAKKAARDEAARRRAADYLSAWMDLPKSDPSTCQECGAALPERAPTGPASEYCDRNCRQRHRRGQEKFLKSLTKDERWAEKAWTDPISRRECYLLLEEHRGMIARCIRSFENQGQGTELLPVVMRPDGNGQSVNWSFAEEGVATLVGKHFPVKKITEAMIWRSVTDRLTEERRARGKPVRRQKTLPNGTRKRWWEPPMPTPVYVDEMEDQEMARLEMKAYQAAQDELEQEMTLLQRKIEELPDLIRDVMKVHLMVQQPTEVLKDVFNQPRRQTEDWPAWSDEEIAVISSDGPIEDSFERAAHVLRFAFDDLTRQEVQLLVEEGLERLSEMDEEDED
jgi:hypothetical protein